ncbi:hypothetical protein IFR05_008720 [Cadophora sp. M221]|nr:hypothetical protein IFR05_008720 [Cadophora sp. M221]
MVEPNEALKRVLSDCEKGLSSNPVYTYSGSTAERLRYKKPDIGNSRRRYSRLLRNFLLPTIAVMYLALIFDIVMIFSTKNALLSIAIPEKTREIKRSTYFIVTTTSYNTEEDHRASLEAHQAIEVGKLALVEASSAFFVPALFGLRVTSTTTFQQMRDQSASTMAATRHLSKLNPNHPIHVQRKERSTTTMPIEKAQAEPSVQSAANDGSSGEPSHKIYTQPLRETILGTAILLVAGAYTLVKLHNTLQEDDAQTSLCTLQRQNLWTLMVGLMITEGLMISCVVLGVAFRVRRACWEGKGRYQTAKEWGREALVVLLPFYLGAMVAVATLARIGWRIFMVKESENIC